MFWRTFDKICIGIYVNRIDDIERPDDSGWEISVSFKEADSETDDVDGGDKKGWRGL